MATTAHLFTMKLTASHIFVIVEPFGSPGLKTVPGGVWNTSPEGDRPMLRKINEMIIGFQSFDYLPESFSLGITPLMLPSFAPWRLRRDGGQG